MAGENVVLTLDKLTRYDGKIKTWTEGVFKIVEQATAETGYLKTYVLQANGTDAADSAKINIPKDFLVKKAEVKAATVADTPVAGLAVGDKYIDFTINTADTANGTATDTHLYIAVGDLVDAYSSGDGITLDPSTNSFSVNTGDGLQINATSKKVEAKLGTGLEINATSKAIDLVAQSSSAGAPAIGGITTADYAAFNGAYDTLTPPTETAPTADSGKNETINTVTHAFATETVGGTTGTLTVTEYYATYGEAVAADAENSITAKSGLMTGAEKANLAALIATFGADVTLATNADIDALFA